MGAEPSSMSEMSPKDRERLMSFEREIAQDPRSLAFVALAEEHNRLGRHDEAASVAQKGLVYHPDSVRGRVALAEAESGRNNVRQALEQLKRALLIDQDNPRALALMGRILLQKGLARRAVQFLSHAVKLDPNESEYGELLARAKKAAQSEAPPAGFRGDQGPESVSPWSEGQDESEVEAKAPDAEHTVFDPETLKKLQSQKRGTRVGTEGQKLSIGEALQQLGAPIDDSSEVEPTRFDTKSQVLKLGLVPGAEAHAEGGERREEPTTYDARLASAAKKKPKVGGSAAEFSQMMRTARKNGTLAPELQEEAQKVSVVDAETPPGDWPAKVSPPPVPSDGPEKKRGSSPGKEKKADSSKAREERGTAAKAAEALNVEGSSGKVAQLGATIDAKDPAEGPPPAKEPKVPKEPKEPKPVPQVEEKKREPSRAIGPAATRMVDDALWALFGGKGPTQEAKAPGVAVEEGAAPAAGEAKEKPAKAASKEDVKAPAPGQMVVRTSERFGTAFNASLMLVAMLGLAWIGYALGVRAMGQPPEVSSEEVKDLASSVDRGGLAGLIAAEEKAETLLSSLPQLESVLSGALADVYAQRWRCFGRDPELKKKAEERLAGLKEAMPSVELLSARVHLSARPEERAELQPLLEQRLVEYPNSPKAWVLRAMLFEAEGRPTDAEAALYRARGIHPQHRLTLLELARHHARRQAWPAAFAYFEQLQAAYPQDIEAVIERYVMSQATGRDPNEKQTASLLASLVREELTEVADDEAGRAALAFAVTRLSRGDLAGALEELAKSELSYRRSPDFKAAVGGVLLAIGEWDRAERAYKEALELDPQKAFRVGVARASLGRRLGLPLDAEALKRAKSQGDGAAVLPFAMVRFVVGRFELVEVEPSRDIFPESAYAAAVAAKDGAALDSALEVASLVALAGAKLRAGAEGQALELVEQAAKLGDDASVRVARGRVFLSKKELPAAITAFKGALALDSKNVAARLGLATAYERKNDLQEAIAALEPLESGEVIVPQAAMLLAKLRTKRGDLEGAARALAPIKAFEATDAAALAARGEAEHRMKKRDDALETFRKALKASGKLPETLSPIQALYIGRIELERGNEKRGVALLKQAVEAEGGPEEAHFHYGKWLIKKPKSKKQGKRELETYRKLAPNGELASEAEKLLR